MILLVQFFCGPSGAGGMQALAGGGNRSGYSMAIRDAEAYARLCTRAFGEMLRRRVEGYWWISRFGSWPTGCRGH
jgi:hypothetical protein